MRSKRVTLFVAVLLSMVAVRTLASSLRAEIQSPKKDQEVGIETAVTGKVSDSQAHLYVLVRPQKTRYWWVQQLPAPPTHEGLWQALSHFGTSTEGAGEPFEIIVIASKKRLDLKEGQKLEDIPDQGVTSDVVTVKRAP
jgi:hypothetical protein